MGSSRWILGFLLLGSCGTTSAGAHSNDGMPKPGGMKSRTAEYDQEIIESERREQVCGFQHLNDTYAARLCVEREQRKQAHFRRLRDRRREDLERLDVVTERARREEATQQQAEETDLAAAEAEASRDERAMLAASSAPPWFCASDDSCSRSAEKCTSTGLECAEQPLAACVSSRNKMQMKTALECFGSTKRCQERRAEHEEDPDYDEVAECRRVPTSWVKPKGAAEDPTSTPVDVPSE